MIQWSSSDVQCVFVSDSLAVSHGQTEGRLTPSWCISLTTTSCERVESNWCGLGLGLGVGVVVGKVLGGGSVMVGVVGVAVGGGNKRLMDWAREDNCYKMVDRSMGVGWGWTPMKGEEAVASTKSMTKASNSSSITTGLGVAVEDDGVEEAIWESLMGKE